MADLKAMSAAELEAYRDKLQKQIEDLRHEFMYAGFELARKRTLGELEAKRAELERKIEGERAKAVPEELVPKDQTVGLKTLSIKGILKVLGKGE